MSSPVRTFENSHEELMGAMNIGLKRIREAEEERANRQKKNPEADLEDLNLAVLNEKVSHLNFLRSNNLNKEAEEFYRLPINNDLRESLDEQEISAAA